MDYTPVNEQRQKLRLELRTCMRRVFGQSVDNPYPCDTETGVRWRSASWASIRIAPASTTLCVSTACHRRKKQGRELAWSEGDIVEFARELHALRAFLPGFHADLKTRVELEREAASALRVALGDKADTLGDMNLDQLLDLAVGLGERLCRAELSDWIAMRCFELSARPMDRLAENLLSLLVESSTSDERRARGGSSPRSFPPHGVTMPITIPTDITLPCASAVIAAASGDQKPPTQGYRRRLQWRRDQTCRWSAPVVVVIAGVEIPPQIPLRVNHEAKLSSMAGSCVVSKVGGR